MSACHAISFPLVKEVPLEPRQTEPKKRFRIEKLEERIAPAHVVVAVPSAAANGVQHVNDNSPHTGLIKTFTFEDRRPGRVFE